MYLDIAYKSRHIVKKNVPRKNKSTYNLERRGYKIFTEILKDKLNGLPTQSSPKFQTNGMTSFVTEETQRTY